MILRRAGEYALVKPGREMLFTAVPAEDKYKTVGGGEEVRADEAVAARDSTGDGVDRQARGVGGEDRFGLAQRVELREQAALEFQVLGHRLDDEVTGRRRVQAGRHADALCLVRTGGGGPPWRADSCRPTKETGRFRAPSACDSLIGISFRGCVGRCVPAPLRPGPPGSGTGRPPAGAPTPCRSPGTRRAAGMMKGPFAGPFAFAARSELDRQAAVDDEHVPVDVGRRLGRQEHRRAGDLFRLAPAPGRVARRDARADRGVGHHLRMCWKR